MRSATISDGGVPPATGSAWAPFRHRLFAAMWGAQFVSNVGGWMQTVGAQWLMLTLIFAVGTGQALTSPTWQTLQPELVAPAERPQAISLGAVNQNLARAVGPAIGGLVLAATSAGTTPSHGQTTASAATGRRRSPSRSLPDTPEAGYSARNWGACGAVAAAYGAPMSATPTS